MDNRICIDFLKLVYPEGPWCLTSIEPNKKGIETRTFGPDTEEQCIQWLSIHNGSRNLYWHVNPVIGDMSTKASRQDIKEVCYLHVDVDPGEGDLAKEQEAILNLFMSKDTSAAGRLPSNVPVPTAVVFSGGGYQAFWKLEEPLPINGDEARAEDAKRYNQWLEDIFGADNCHNIDRLMRLPGTMNLPDAKKSKKGRVPTLAEKVWFVGDRIYPLTSFKQAAPRQTDSAIAKPASGIEVTISGNVRKVATLDELDQYNIPDRVKVIIVQGSHPDPEEIQKKCKDGKRPSRSEWLFDVCCNLVRCGVPDEVIYAIITDKDWPISESVVELKSGAHRYAVRQIAKAKEHAIEPWLQKLNQSFTVVGNLGGKCRIMEEVVDHFGEFTRSRLTKQSFEDFRNRFMNQKVQVGTDAQGNPRFMPAGKWWLEHPNRSQVDKIVFQPDVVEVPGCLNLWKGYAYEPKPGDKHLGYLKHLKEVICADDEENYEYLIKWMARVVQQPASPGQVAIVLQGGRGSGKGTFCHHFGALFGRHYVQVSNPNHLVGNFNAHLRDSLVIFSDEAFYAGDRKHTSVLKTLITEDQLTIEGKGVDVEFTQNYVHLIMASNDDHVVRAGIDERRFFILKTAEHRKQQTGYFGPLNKDMMSGGRENLLYFLQSVDLTGFDVWNVPKTEALLEQTDMSLDPKEEWWSRKLRDGAIMADDDEWVQKVPRKDLFEAFVREAQLGNRYVVAGTATQFGIWMNKRIPGLKQGWASIRRKVINDGGFELEMTKRERCYVFPSLEICRKAWEHYIGKSVDWASEDDE